jgi:hypothetical protein
VRSPMPPERWRVLGRLLPREVRERVFEPAFSDLLYAWLTRTAARPRVPFALRVMGTVRPRRRPGGLRAARPSHPVRCVGHAPHLV